MKVEPAGKALIANNNQTLAWIAGPKGNFTDKTHSYPAGASVAKQVVLINDTRRAQKATYSWAARIGGKAIAQKTQAATVPPGKTVQLPFEFKLPSTLAGAKADGQITLTATIGARKHSDTFAFRAFAPTASAKGSVRVFDPKGRTSTLLKSLGYSVQPWDGKPSNGVVIIGREALSGSGKLPGDLEAFVRGGGRAVVFNQNPAWVQDYLGWRTVPYVSRRVFPLPNPHPVTAGLDEKDLRDWAGTSDLVEAYPDPDKTPRGAHGGPKYGWRWGNRHMVTSAPVEKPHRSGWRPILEAEFDLAYTPLMELDYGKGRLIWCGLDLEEHATVDPAARRVARQLMQYAATAPLSPRAATVTYVGGDSGANLLDSLGVIYTRAQQLNPKSTLTLLAADASVSEAALRAYVQQGGRVVVLPGENATAPLAAKRVMKANFAGSLDVPAWPEAAGLSASDLRYRAPAESWLLAQGGGLEVGAGGLLGRQRIGKGVVVWVQIDPRRFNAEENTYLRFTRWRSTRALSQVLANLGASFKTDSQVFHPRSRSEGTVSLAGRWAAKWVQRIADPEQQTHADKGISNSAKAMMRVAQHDAHWERLLVPGMWETNGGLWDKANGEVVYRMTVELPASAAGKEMLLSLGKIDDRDETLVQRPEGRRQPGHDFRVQRRAEIHRAGSAGQGRQERHRGARVGQLRRRRLFRPGAGYVPAPRSGCGSRKLLPRRLHRRFRHGRRPLPLLQLVSAYPQSQSLNCRVRVQVLAVVLAKYLHPHTSLLGRGVKHSLRICRRRRRKRMTTRKKFVLKSRLASVCFSVLALGVTTALAPVRAQDAKPAANVFPEGSFEMPDGTGWVMGWPDLPNPNDSPWKAGARMTIGEETEGDKKNHFARIKTTPEYAGFYAAGAYIALPAGAKQITMSIRSRARVDDTPKADWRGARLSIQYMDAEGTPLKGAKVGVIGDVQDTREEWKRDQATVDLPDGTEGLYVSLIVGGLVGQFDFDDLEVTVTKGPGADAGSNK
jgi:hypothetical protein